MISNKFDLHFPLFKGIFLVFTSGTKENTNQTSLKSF